MYNNFVASRKCRFEYLNMRPFSLKKLWPLYQMTTNLQLCEDSSNKY